MTDHIIAMYQDELAKLDALDPREVAKTYSDATVADARVRITKAQASLEETIRARKAELGLPDPDQARASA